MQFLRIHAIVVIKRFPAVLLLAANIILKSVPSPAANLHRRYLRSIGHDDTKSSATDGAPIDYFLNNRILFHMMTPWQAR